MKKSTIIALCISQLFIYPNISNANPKQVIHKEVKVVFTSSGNSSKSPDAQRYLGGNFPTGLTIDNNNFINDGGDWQSQWPWRDATDDNKIAETFLSIQRDGDYGYFKIKLQPYWQGTYRIDKAVLHIKEGSIKCWLFLQNNNCKDVLKPGSYELIKNEQPTPLTLGRMPLSDWTGINYGSLSNFGIDIWYTKY